MKKATIIVTKKRGGMKNLVAYANFPTMGISGMKFLCFVFSICSENSMMTPGISRKTETRLIRIALIRTIPRSGPILYCMKVMAIRPPMVVREEPDISGIALERASITASLGGRV